VTAAVERVLFVCRANACRSPVAAELFRRHLDAVGAPVPEIASAGVDARDVRVREDAVDALAEAGVDLARHTPTPLTPEMLRDSDVVVTMERAVVRTAVNAEPHVWPRAFTLKELVRRAHDVGARHDGETVAEWVARLHAGRTPTDMQGDGHPDDVTDPYAGPRRGYAKLVNELDALTATLARLGWRAPR
jgi:protein-tyrosine phosphatase